VVDGTAYEEKCRYQERDSSSDQYTGNDSKESKYYEGFSSESPPDTGKYYVGKGLHSPFLEDQLADEEEWPSPGQFGKRYDFQQRTWSEAWYSGKKVTWLNREPKYDSKEFAMATIVVGIHPAKLRGFFGSDGFFMLTIHVQTGNKPTTQEISHDCSALSPIRRVIRLTNIYSFNSTVFSLCGRSRASALHAMPG
jgi:hypothetical protein